MIERVRRSVGRWRRARLGLGPDAGLPWTLVVGLLVGVACGQISGPDAIVDGDSDGSDDGAQAPDPALCAPITIATTDEPGARQLQRIATRDQIPGLAVQPTAHGQILGTLVAFDGRLHLGYGDYSDNTGPIEATTYDPVGGVFSSMGFLPTEEVLWMRPGAGALYVPAIDPDGHEEEGGIYRLDCGSPSWLVSAPIEGAVHVYDVAFEGDAIYATTGSLTGAPARLVVSEDYGGSWTEVLQHPSPSGRFSRMNFVARAGDRMFVSGHEHPEPLVPLAWLRTGDGDFEPVVDPPDGSLVPVVLGEAMVIARYSGNPGRGRHLDSHVLEGNTLVPAQPWPVLPGGEASLVAWQLRPADAMHPERLLVLVLDPNGEVSVQQTADLAQGADGWTELAALPSDALDGEEVSSMALLLGDLYLGTRTGSLFVLRELETPAG